MARAEKGMTMADTEAKALALVKRALDYADRQICRHEDTHRGGTIWTICHHCDQKWADDDGGFKPSSWPEIFDEAMAELNAQAATEARHAAELRELKERFSGVVTDWFGRYSAEVPPQFQPFILPAPDPLVDVFDECFEQGMKEGETWSESMARKARTALASRGGKIVWEAGE